MAEGEGGIGGKLKRKLNRRPAATPYDRPVRGLNPVEVNRTGWVSRIVEPASALIYKGANRLFSSVFRKRLAAPPATEPAVQNLESGEVVEEILVSNSGADAERGVTQDIQDPRDGDGISELERFLKQKTFTREEYDRLSDLLRARTINLSKGKDNENIVQVMPPPMENPIQQSEKFSAFERKIERSVGGNSVPDSSLKISGVELASPAEVAKAYMGSRPSKVSPSSLSLRSHMFRDITPSPSFASMQQKVTASTNGSVSAVRFPSVRGAPDNGSMTPASRGRSAIYRMSRSPYFRPQPTMGSKEVGKLGADHAGSSASKEIAIPSGTQALKRRSSVLEDDIGSGGPIRRIRQKSSLITPLKSARQELASPLSQQANFFDSTDQSSSSLRKKVDLPSFSESMKGVDVSVPPQSREMAKKILNQLDKLVPSPKDKGSETKTIFRDEPPSKLTVDMLHGQALKSVSEKDSSKLFIMEGSGKLESKNDASFERPGQIPSTSSIFGDKAAISEPQSIDGVMETKTVKNTLSFAAVSQPKRPAFKMQAPLDPAEFENNERDVSFPSIPTGKKVDTKDQKFVASDSFLRKKPEFFGEVSAGSHISEVKLEQKSTINGSIISGKEVDFTFQVSGVPEKPRPSGDEDSVPVFNFGSKTSSLRFSPGLASSSESSAKSVSTAITKPEADTQEKKQQPSFLFHSSAAQSSFAFSTSTSSISSQLAAPPAPAAPINGAFSATTSFFASSSSASVSASSTVSVSASTSTPLFSSSSPFSFQSAPSFQFSKDSSSAPLNPPAAIDSTPKPAKESIFSVPASSTVSMPAPAKESVFGLPTASVTTTTTPKLADSAQKSATESIFGLPPASATPTFPLAADSAPKQVTGSIFGLPPSSAPVTTTAAADSAPKQVTESIFGQPSSSMTPAIPTATDSATTQVKQSIFGLPSTPATLTTPAATTSVPNQVKESIFGLGASPATTPAVAPAESIFGVSKPSAASVAPFSSNGSGLLGTGAPSPFVQSTASQFNISASAPSSIFNPSAAAATGISLTSSSSTSAAASIFGVGSSQSTAASSVFGSGFGSSAPAFGAPSSSAPLFSFTQAAASAAPISPVFGFSSPAASPFKPASASPGNDQMNEDTMADDTTTAAAPPSTPIFGSAAPFQFASPQTGAFMAGQPAFQPGTGAEFHGSFSMGSGDKSVRRFVKAKRDKHRKK